MTLRCKSPHLPHSTWLLSIINVKAIAFNLKCGMFPDNQTHMTVAHMQWHLQHVWLVGRIQHSWHSKNLDNICWIALLLAIWLHSLHHKKKRSMSPKYKIAEEIFCTCRGIEIDEMISCDSCSTWFHVSCVCKNSVVPSGSWYCHECISLYFQYLNKKVV